MNLGPNGGRRKLETKSLREAFFSEKGHFRAMSRVAIFGDIFSGFFRLSRRGPFWDPDLSHFRRFRLKGRVAPGIASKKGLREFGSKRWET